MQTIGSTLAAEVAEILDQANIPHLLWGFLAITLVGVNRHPLELEFIVPDEQIQSASEALYEAGFCLCANPGCPDLRIDQFYPIADVHFHLEGMTDEHRILSLFTKSSMIWWLPDLSLSHPPEDDPYYILSTSPRLPPRQRYGASGPWTHLYPIRLLNPNAMTEAVIMLNIRDLKQSNGIEQHWHYMLIDLMEGREIPEASVKKILPPRLMPFWVNYNRLDEHRVGSPLEMLKELRREMVANDELPPPPAYNAYGSIEEARLNECDI